MLVPLALSVLGDLEVILLKALRKDPQERYLFKPGAELMGSICVNNPDLQYMIGK